MSSEAEHVAEKRLFMRTGTQKGRQAAWSCQRMILAENR